MTELEVLIAIHRAIDRAVTADETGRARAVAARYIPLYADPRSAGWTESLAVVLGPGPGAAAAEAADPPPQAVRAEPAPVEAPPPVRGRRDREPARFVPDPSFEPLEPDAPVRAALHELAASNPQGRMLSRLLVALAVLGRVAPPVLESEEGPLLDADFLDALIPFLPPTGDLPREDLGLQLLDDGRFPDITRWHEFAADATASFALRSDVAEQPPPCVDSIVVGQVDGKDVAVARMATLLGTDKLSDAQVEWFLNPGNWPQCSTLYCGMLSQGADPVEAADAQKGVLSIERWLEVLSPTCPDAATDPIEVCLVFTKTKRGDQDWLLEYDLDPTLGNGKVVVDHGTIEVAKQGTHWWFSTTKYLRFAGVVDGSHMGLIACVLGYGAYAEDYLNSDLVGTTGPAPDP